MNNRYIRNARKTSLRVEFLERCDFLSVVVSNGELDSEPSGKTTDSSYYEGTVITASLLNQDVISVEGVSTTQLATTDLCVDSAYTEQRSLNLDNSEKFYSVLAKDVFYRLKKTADSRADALASIVSEWLNPPDETFPGKETFLDSDELTDSILTSDHVLTYRLPVLRLLATKMTIGELRC